MQSAGVARERGLDFILGPWGSAGDMEGEGRVWLESRKLGEGRSGATTGMFSPLSRRWSQGITFPKLTPVPYPSIEEQITREASRWPCLGAWDRVTSPSFPSPALGAPSQTHVQTHAPQCSGGREQRKEAGPADEATSPSGGGTQATSPVGPGEWQPPEEPTFIGLRALSTSRPLFLPTSLPTRGAVIPPRSKLRAPDVRKLT